MAMKKCLILLGLLLTFCMCSMAQTAITHTVKHGESLYGIAKKYGVTVELIKQVNPNMGDYFYEGLVLNIPVKIEDNPNQGTAESLGPTIVEPSNTVVSNPTEAPKPPLNENSNDIKTSGLMYWGFKGFDNYGYFTEALTYNGFGAEMAIRTQFKSHANYNIELGINYALGLYREDNIMVMAIGSFTPLSIRSQSGLFMDCCCSARLSVKYDRVAITGGYFYWWPKWGADSNEGISGFCIGLQYAL